MTSAQLAERLATAIRAGAAGLYSLEAACELLINAGWLHRDDFTRFIRTQTPAAAGDELAEIDWQAIITSRDAGQLPCSGGENRILRLAASIAAGIPVDLNHALSGLDHASITLVIRAVRHANGTRPDEYPARLPGELHHTAAGETQHGPPPSPQNSIARTGRPIATQNHCTRRVRKEATPSPTTGWKATVPRET
jgi:hypothetical protein